MADFNALETLINAYIKKNGVQAITGNILNGVLRGMVSALGKGYTIVGVATPSTDPGTLTGPCAYYASTYGTYTNFGNIVVNDGEIAMLIYDEQTWHKEKMWRLDAEASIDANVGTPSVETSFEDELLTFRFHNIKGEQGDAAGFGTVTASVDSNIGTPGVSVQTSGPDTAKNMTFQFTNLKGETGVTSVVCTVDNTIGTPSCAVSLVGQELHLDFSGLKGNKGDTGVSADYPITIYNGLDSTATDQALSAYQGKVLNDEISQLELKQYGFYQLIWDNLGASAFWGEKPDIHFGPNTVLVNITLATGLSISNTSPITELGQPYIAQITPNANYRIVSISCLMGGVSQTVIDGLISIAEVTSGLIIVATAEGLDDVAYESLTYRQIFETNNLLEISPGFEDGTYNPMTANLGTPTITSEQKDSGTYSLKVFGSSSQQLKSASSFPNGLLLFGVRVKVVSYTQGFCGFSFASSNVGAAISEVSDWVTKTGSYNDTGYRNAFLGSNGSANLDGYIDTPVAISGTIFTNAPSAEEWEQLYYNYVIIKKS